MKLLRRHPRATLVAALVVAAFAIGCSGETTPNYPPLPKVTAPADGAHLPTGPGGIGDGTYRVGRDLKAGTYTTTVPADSFGCYWARLKDFDGELGSIAANGDLSPGAKGRMTVKATDKGVEFTGGCKWAKAAAK